MLRLPSHNDVFAVSPALKSLQNTERYLRLAFTVQVDFVGAQAYLVSQRRDRFWRLRHCDVDVTKEKE